MPLLGVQSAQTRTMAMVLLNIPCDIWWLTGRTTFYFGVANLLTILYYHLAVNIVSPDTFL